MAESDSGKGGAPRWYYVVLAVVAIIGAITGILNSGDKNPSGNITATASGNGCASITQGTGNNVDCSNNQNAPSENKK